MIINTRMLATLGSPCPTMEDPFQASPSSSYYIINIIIIIIITMIIMMTIQAKENLLFGIFIASLQLSYCTVYHLHCTT